MATLADTIEKHLKRLLATAGEDVIEIRRCDIAQRFDCVPSQINYVLETRFTPQRGYYVESRRGGGGYIRIIRAPARRETLSYERLYSEIGSRISARRAESLLRDLVEYGILDGRKASLLKGAMRQETIDLDPPWDDFVRAKLLKVMLLLVFQEAR